MQPKTLAGLLSFNGGFVDTTGFIGMQGLFVAHVTGNFVTLAATLLTGTHGIVAKVLVLPEFMLVVLLARLAAGWLRGREAPVLRILLSTKLVLLLAFFLLAVRFGPFPDTDMPAALLTAFAGVAAMAVQNAVQRVHLSALPPTTLMTGNVTQLVLDVGDLIQGAAGDKLPQIKTRLANLVTGVLCFAVGCGVAAGLYAWVGFWCLTVPVVIAAIAAFVRLET